MPIQKLSPLIANQIAAGEVVERPASVVKELLENSIDAGATRIQIDLERGGIRLIRITDNGHGIPKEELSLALSRHATSKILEAKDLAAIETLGFRGEALASISSVSKLTLSSKPEHQDIGWSAYTEGQEMDVKLLPHSLPFGSIVEVKDLFFNTPARQKFLKAERTEFVHVEEVVKKVALANPTIAVTLKHNGKVTKRIPAANNTEQVKQRIGTIVGRPFIQKAIQMKSELEDLTLSGWLGPIDYHQSSSLNQYFFVNGRPVRDRTISHAVRQAYHDLLPTGRSPAFVLFLEMPADKLDINVHPTKHEVRFIEGRRVHDYIIKAIETSLQDYASGVDFNNGISEISQSFTGSKVQALAMNPIAESPIDTEYSGVGGIKRSPLAIQEKESYYQPKKSNKARQTQLWFDRYLIQQNDNELLLLDLKSYLLDAIKSSLESEWNLDEVKQKPILIPLRFSIDDSSDLERFLSESPRLGFDISQLGPSSIIVRKIPAVIEQTNVESWLENSIANMKASNNLESILTDSLTFAWAPELKTNWFEMIEQRASLNPWKTSDYCYPISENALLKFVEQIKTDRQGL